jgi:hypothetical protein
MLQVRVRFSSSVATPRSGGSPMKVSVARLVLETRGTPQSLASRGSGKPATIEFHGRYLRELRKQEEAPEFALIAKLSGSLAFDEKTLIPRFTLGADAELEHEEPPPEEGKPFRQLKIEFDPENFLEIPSAESPACRLRLTTPPEIEGEPEPRHFELTTLLQVSGSVESELEVSDVLDVPLGPIRVGLVLEWPSALDESVPNDLVLVAKQGGIERKLEWLQGDLDGDRRRFLFRGILGAAPVDLNAITQGKTVVLWEQQDITQLEKPNVWKNTLEDVFASPRPTPDGKKPSFVSKAVLRSNVVKPTELDFGNVDAVDPFEEA